MDLELSDDQRATVDLTRSMVGRRFALEHVRRLEGAGVAVGPADWQALGEAGVFSLALPEAAGGAGLGLADAALVFAELGRGLVPGPLVATAVAAGVGARAAGDVAVPGDDAAGGEAIADLLGAAADGASAVTLVRRPPAGGPVLVEHAAQAAAVLVVEPGGGLSLLGAGELGPVGEAVALDPLTPVVAVPTLAAGRPVPPGPAGPWQRDQRVLTAAFLVGVAAATCEMAVTYAKGREQFGRPIGGFQAVKHLCADMVVRAETARAAVDVAALSADQPGTGDPDRLAAGAALVAADAAVANAKTCIQVHGGMGYTWEVPAHLYLMRARVLAGSLGPLDDLAREVAAAW